jgi:hypothetical protein
VVAVKKEGRMKEEGRRREKEKFLHPSSFILLPFF